MFNYLTFSGLIIYRKDIVIANQTLIEGIYIFVLLYLCSYHSYKNMCLIAGLHFFKNRQIKYLMYNYLTFSSLIIFRKDIDIRN